MAVRHLGVTQAQVDKAFGFPDISKFGNLSDTPANHADALNRLGVRWRWVDVNAIERMDCNPGKTVILLHSLKNPVLMQHWAVVEIISGQGAALDMGTPDMKPVWYSWVVLRNLYTAGGPTNTAYEVLGMVEKKKVNIFCRLWAFISAKIYR
jgi:uncharacterized protein YlzI (FlbEa/FlbD family)